MSKVSKDYKKPIRVEWQRRRNLIKGPELDVMTVEDIDVIQLQSGKALIDAPGHPLRAEVESVLVASTLGGDDELLAWHLQLAEAVT